MHGSLSFQVVGKIVGSPAVPSPIDFPDPLRTDLDEMGMVHPETSWRCWSPVLTYNTFRDSEERERPTRSKTVFMRRFWVPLLTYTLISCRIIDMLSSLDVLLNDSKGQGASSPSCKRVITLLGLLFSLGNMYVLVL